MGSGTLLVSDRGKGNTMLASGMDAGTDKPRWKLEGQSRPGLANFSSREPMAPARRMARRNHGARCGPGFAVLFLLLVRRRPFLWADENPDRAQLLKTGEILVEAVEGGSPQPVPHGLIHDWIGTVFVPKAKLDGVMGVLDDYNRYKDFYRPLVAKASVLEKTSDHEKVTLLMVQKAYSVTAAVETDNDVRINRLDAARAYSTSLSVRVQEIDDYGQPSEHELPEGHGPGYIWRTFILTRLEQRDDGVYVEMEMIGMSRSIPFVFRWLVQPLAERLPSNILQLMLKDTRDAVSQETK
jgi:hypothetical protein